PQRGDTINTMETRPGRGKGRKTMKKYYIVRGNFANVYTLFWADGPEMEAKLPENAEQINRKEAENLCRDEKWRRKYDFAFSGYASSTIFPAGYAGSDFGLYDDRRYELRGY